MFKNHKLTFSLYILGLTLLAAAYVVFGAINQLFEGGDNLFWAVILSPVYISLWIAGSLLFLVMSIKAIRIAQINNSYSSAKKLAVGLIWLIPVAVIAVFVQIPTILDILL